MLRNRLYYAIKPFLPLGTRRAIRRQFALRKREKVRDRWPILPGSERPPEGWRGWPEGKQFAFVLTHDVEGQFGVNQSRELMQMERGLGFRSSFNFIPEGEYRVSRELREELAANGFEVGVHDLNHDGKLYRSHREFLEKAERINAYLKDWNAVGFRSAFMLHNLDWLGKLNVRYDASTFDTDPFEPQPDNAGTIFPFWVPRAPLNPQPSTPSDGYVELPYTLAQDSTLFLILGERKPDVWLQKLDWIAKHGGMALVNVHPDYLSFSGERDELRRFPAELYEQLLKYVRERYGSSYWQPLPRELADFATGLKPALREAPKRACMISHSNFYSDTRVSRYAEALAERGDLVDVVALGPEPEKERAKLRDGIRVACVQQRERKNERSKPGYLLPLLGFLCKSSIWVARRHIRKPYDVIHVHNVPDFLVFAALLPKLTGARVILDIHDILPEFYGSKFGSGQNGLGVWAMRWLERISARVADHVILGNDLWLEKYASRTGSVGKCSVDPNNVDTDLFHPRPRTRRDGKFIILFPGGLQWHQGLDIAIKAFAKISSEIPAAEFHIYGDGNMREELIALSRSLGLGEKVRFFNEIPVREIADIMANADLSVVPKRADSFGNEAYSTKIMEFMSLGVPVVASATRIDRFYFDDSVVRFFESGNVEALAEAMLEVIRNEELRRRLVSNASAYALRNCWEPRKKAYLDLVDSLIGGQRYVPVARERTGAGRLSVDKPRPADPLARNGAGVG